MADIKPAKAGTKLSKKARLAWAKRAQRPGQTIEDALLEAPELVAEKSEGSRGAWFCMTCGEVHRNHFEAHWHASRHPTHAWLSLDSDRLEEP